MRERDASLEPTTGYGPGESQSSSTTGDQLPVGLIAGTVPQFSDETAVILRRRLKSSSLVLAALTAFALLRNLFVHGGNISVALQAVGLLSLVTFYFVLSSSQRITLFQLRAIELLVFGALFVAVAVAEWIELHRSASAGEFDAVVVIRFFASFSILILTYGMLMPNSWRRAAVILFPVACIPFAVMWTTMSDKLAIAMEFEPLPLVAAVLAVFGTHIINSNRQSAYNARRFQQYRLKEKLGAGGMGEVYRAEHLLLKRPCVIKLIRQEKSTDAASLARFEREVQSTAQLTHWNSLEIFDYGHTDDGVFYYVMEYLSGKSLEDLVSEHGPLPPERAVHFLRQVCRALREAHQLGLIHRDLKPANIFAANLGGVHDVAKLLDFGLVRQATADRPESLSLTQEGSFSGSPLYMPPEQVVAYNEVDGRADIYALGAVAYFLLTGRPPFEGRNPIEVILDHANKPVTPPSNFVPTIPTDLESVVLTCLEKRPADRFQNVVILEGALAACECADKWTEEMADKWWGDASVGVSRQGTGTEGSEISEKFHALRG
jgi:tRNA A-37 threonylcarbamoyl transferase component Bud32